jgi:predicted glycosyltransferase involved in capsule biosynthesis
MFDYKNIAENNTVIIQSPEEAYDINFLIPVRGRREFAEPMYKSFLKAKENSSLSIVYTVIEHSSVPDHAKFCKKNKLNYIWIKSAEGELFNKCLCYNMGALYSNVSKYIIFHDLDCLIQSDFFVKIALNISNQKCKAIQCFKDRRVLYCDENLTKEIIEEKVSVDDLNLDFPGIDLPRLGGVVMLGAPGGSILVERGLFFEVGGYDDHLFLANSPEDAYFWEKIDSVDKMYIAESPNVDIFHMFHPPTYYSNPHLMQMKKTFEDFKSLAKEQKMEIIKEKSQYFKKFMS